MLDITIYYKDGRRSMYHHVAQITCITNENCVLDFITDFGDHISKTLKAADIAEVKAVII